MVYEIFQFKKQNKIAYRIAQSQRIKKISAVTKIINEAKTCLEITDRKNVFAKLQNTSLILIVVGVFVSIIFRNFFLIPVLAIGLGLAPFWYTIISSYQFQKQINDELETSLSTITTSYLRNENIVTSVKENLQYINTPVLEVFKGFIAETELISTNLKYALLNMKNKINNSIFHEWIDAIILCQDDRTLKSTLAPIITKLSDVKSVSMDLESSLYEPLKEFITMAILLFANIPLLFFLNKTWFYTLIGTLPGKFVLALSIGITIFSFAAVMRLTKPIKYER